MTRFNTEQITALTLLIAIITSFAVTMDVGADPVFPPRHTQAVFDEPTAQSATSFSGPWYRPVSQAKRQDVKFSVDDKTGNYILANRSVGPWYRPVN